MRRLRLAGIAVLILTIWMGAAHGAVAASEREPQARDAGAPRDDSPASRVTRELAPPVDRPPASAAEPELRIRADAQQRSQLAHRRAQRAAERQAARGPLSDRQLIPVRIALLSIGGLAFAMPLFRRFAALPHMRTVRAVIIVVTAIASLATYYHFFLGNYKHGFDSTDVFHYYVGSKYSDELGYFRLYECTLWVVAEGQRRPFAEDQRARDLRTMKVVDLAEVLERGRSCQQRFTPERWQSFTGEVMWFTDQWSTKIYHDVFKDYGYQPSPVWNAIGGAVANRVSLTSEFNRSVLLYVDRALVAASISLLLFAYGWEIACVFTILWGSGYLWRYGFVGDGYMRHLWWFGLIVGVCALRLGRSGAAGMALAFASAVRVFPGAFALTYAVAAARRVLVDRAPSAPLLRFMGYGIAGGLALLAIGAVTDARGPGAYVEFVDKLGAFARLGVTNRVGWSVVTTWLFGATPWLASGVRLFVVVVFGLVLYRALGRCRDDEAAVLGLTLIPFATDPTNYYYAFVPLGIVLGLRRPAIVAVLFSACLCWNINGWFFYRTYDEYFHASQIAVIACFAIAALMASGPTSESHTAVH